MLLVIGTCRFHDPMNTLTVRQVPAPLPLLNYQSVSKYFNEDYIIDPIDIYVLHNVNNVVECNNVFEILNKYKSKL